MKLNVKPTITEQELKSILVGLSGLDDFELIIKNEYNLMIMAITIMS